MELTTESLEDLLGFYADNAGLVRVLWKARGKKKRTEREEFVWQVAENSRRLHALDAVNGSVDALVAAEEEKREREEERRQGDMSYVDGLSIRKVGMRITPRSERKRAKGKERASDEAGGKEGKEEQEEQVEVDEEREEESAASEAMRLVVVTNTACPSYPPEVTFVVPERVCRGKTERETEEEFADSLLRSCAGRGRGRGCAPAFYVPFTDTLVCRSAALVQKPELLLRRLTGQAVPVAKRGREKKERSRMRRIRDADGEALLQMGVRDVCDLMVEAQLLRFGRLQCVTSEKNVSGESYAECVLHVLPFPGIELNVLYDREIAKKMAGGEEEEAKEVAGRYASAFSKVHFDWRAFSIGLASRALERTLPAAPGVDWKKWQEWDGVTLAKRYLRVMLYCIAHPEAAASEESRQMQHLDSKGGILVHCISGWDRTPLFVSLLRVLLWADGLVHAWMSPLQLAYHTVAYDWLLFGHDMAERLELRVEVIAFFVCLLAEVEGSHFSLAEQMGFTRRGRSNKEAEKSAKRERDGREEERKLLAAFTSRSERKRRLRELSGTLVAAYPWAKTAKGRKRRKKE